MNENFPKFQKIDWCQFQKKKSVILKEKILGDDQGQRYNFSKGEKVLNSQFQISNSKFWVSNFQSQVSNSKCQISKINFFFQRTTKINQSFLAKNENFKLRMNKWKSNISKTTGQQSTHQLRSNPKFWLFVGNSSRSR